MICCPVCLTWPGSAKPAELECRCGRLKVQEDCVTFSTARDAAGQPLRASLFSGVQLRVRPDGTLWAYPTLEENIAFGRVPEATREGLVERVVGMALAGEVLRS